jgi:hypothetical protein
MAMGPSINPIKISGLPFVRAISGASPTKLKQIEAAADPVYASRQARHFILPADKSNFNVRTYSFYSNAPRTLRQNPKRGRGVTLAA